MIGQFIGYFSAITVSALGLFWFSEKISDRLDTEFYRRGVIDGMIRERYRLNRAPRTFRRGTDA